MFTLRRNPYGHSHFLFYLDVLVSSNPSMPSNLFAFWQPSWIHPFTSAPGSPPTNRIRLIYVGAHRDDLLPKIAGFSFPSPAFYRPIRCQHSSAPLYQSVVGREDPSCYSSSNQEGFFLPEYHSPPHISLVTVVPPHLFLSKELSSYEPSPNPDTPQYTSYFKAPPNQT